MGIIIDMIAESESTKHVFVKIDRFDESQVLQQRISMTFKISTSYHL